MKFIKKGDIAIIALILITALSVFLIYAYKDRETGSFAEIYYKSELAMKVDLTKGEERSFSIPENPDVVFHLYPDGSLCFEKSDCPDKICIKSGKLKNTGDSAACLPNQIVVKIVTGGKTDNGSPDIVIG